MIMKNCNNCGTINIDSATHCTHCNMKGQFTFQGLPIKKTITEQEKIHCTNCGTVETGSGTKCLECNFPLPLNKDLSNDSEKPTIRMNVKTG